MASSARSRGPIGIVRASCVLVFPAQRADPVARQLRGTRDLRARAGDGIGRLVEPRLPPPRIEQSHHPWIADECVHEVSTQVRMPPVVRVGLADQAPADRRHR
jgi:hypothetical protein